MKVYLCILVIRIILFSKVLCRTTLVNATETADSLTEDDRVKPITKEDWLNNIVPSTYDKTISPARFINDTETGITLNILPISISEISEMNMYFEVELIILVIWKEPRLPFDEIKNRSTLIFLTPPREFQDHVWNPYLIFANCKLCEDKRQIANSEIKHLEIWLRVLEESVALLYRETLKFSCHFHLHKYPLDSHECSIFIELLVLPKERGHLFLKTEPYENISASHYVEKFIPAQYKLNDVVLVNECSDLNPLFPNQSNNECIRISFRFHRLIYSELMLLYLPSFFIVVVSWLSFWMDVEASSPRVALGLTSLLTLSTQFANGQKSLPPVSYIKAMDVWMLTCSFMVFISLVEFFLSCQLKNWRMDQSIGNDSALSTVDRSFKKNHLKERNMKQHGRKSESPTTKVDFISRIIFPTTFLIFNIAYWSYYA